MMRINAKAIPINDTDYSCHITSVASLTDHMESMWSPYYAKSHHIMPLVMNSLRGGHTQIDR